MKNKRTLNIVIIASLVLGGASVEISESLAWVFRIIFLVALLARFQPLLFPTKEQKEARKQRWAERRKAAEENQRQQRREKEEERKRRIELLASKYDESTAIKIVDGKKWVGMTDAMLIDSLGRPLAQKEEVSKDLTKRSFYYQSKKTAEGKTRYKLKIDLDNTKVVGWKEGDFSA